MKRTGLAILLLFLLSGHFVVAGATVPDSGKNAATPTLSVKKKKKTNARLGVFGSFVRLFLKGDLSKKLFARYWTGQGDYELSDTEITVIAQEITRLGNAGCTDSSYVRTADSVVLQRKLINFYLSGELSNAFGYGTVYLNRNELAGFYDNYDFNPKPWGTRPFKHELKTRMMHIIGKLKGARTFNVYYGIQP
ncbi:MAG: hypothetical protein JNM68_07865 [Dinghuibacter sp.]|nr:hypothetical protein [Dinghuibacter sp.]